MARTEENVYRGVIALVAASETGMHGRRRTQKAAYFAGVMRATDFSGVRFQYQAFGPYSRQISECLQYLVAAGFVMERESYKEDGEVQYIYKLTTEGETWVRENSLIDFDLLRRVVGVSQETNEKALELAARAEFFHTRGGGGCEIDVKGAATLAGPEWDGFVKEATKVLEALGLKQGEGEARAGLDRPEGVLLKPAPVFVETRPEEVFGSVAWDGPPRSLEDMEAGVLEEAKRRDEGA